MSDFVFCKIENHFCPRKKEMIYSIKKDNINLFLNKLKDIYNVIYYNINDNKLSVVIYNYFLYYHTDIESRKNAINEFKNQAKCVTVLFNEKIIQVA